MGYILADTNAVLMGVIMDTDRHLESKRSKAMDGEDFLEYVADNREELEDDFQEWYAKRYGSLNVVPVHEWTQEIEDRFWDWCKERFDDLES